MTCKLSVYRVPHKILYQLALAIIKCEMTPHTIIVMPTMNYDVSRGEVNLDTKSSHFGYTSYTFIFSI